MVLGTTSICQAQGQSLTKPQRVEVQGVLATRLSFDEPLQECSPLTAAERGLNKYLGPKCWGPCKAFRGTFENNSMSNAAYGKKFYV